MELNVPSFGETEGLTYYVMGYVAGESLADRLQREERIPPAEIRQIIADIAGALDYAHRHGVVHRDVKPGNVLLDDESGRAMLLDFGVARAQTVDATLTLPGSVIGTPHYLSPEQASGHREVDGRSDLYSLGIMGYVMLTGAFPFDGGFPWILILLIPAMSIVYHWINWRFQLRPNGRSWSDTWRVLLREPKWLKWWALWYPHALSLPSTIRMKEYRRRLSRSFRLLGNYTLFCLAFTILVVGWNCLILLSRITEPAEISSYDLLIEFTGLILLAVFLISHIWAAFVWQVKRGFNNREYSALLGLGKLARDPVFWEQPKIQRYLSPSGNSKVSIE